MNCKVSHIVLFCYSLDNLYGNKYLFIQILFAGVLIPLKIVVASFVFREYAKKYELSILVGPKISAYNKSEKKILYNVFTSI